MNAALAATPIVLVLAAMLAFGWSAAAAGAAGLGLACALALSAFGFGADAGAWPRAFALTLAEAAFLSATILWILWPALALHHRQQAAGGLDAVRNLLGKLSGQRMPQLLLVGWFLALFVEGAAGFGTPVALAAPLLVGLGVAPVRAVVLALLGHAAGVSFGALGTPVLAQLALTGLEPAALAARTALLHALLGGVLMLFFVRVAREADGSATGWPWIAAPAFLLPSLGLALYAGPELPTLGGALVGAFVFALLLRRQEPRRTLPGRAVAALAPYVVLVLLVLATRTVPPLADRLGDVVVMWSSSGGFGGQVRPLTHPGTLLLAAYVAGGLLQRSGAAALAASLAHSARMLVPVAVALFMMLALSRLMLHAGLIEALQAGAVRGVGTLWPLVAPAIGALGSFVTGSATASNILFTTLQAQTAQALGWSVAWMVAAQGFGAAVGNIVCPHNIVAGAATVGVAGREGEILRATLGPCLVYLLLGGLAVLALLLLAG